MDPQRRHSSEEALELLESEDDGESGADSFFTDDELPYQEGADPAEELSYFCVLRDDYQQDGDFAAGHQASSSGELPPQQRRARSRSPPHSRARSRSRSSHARSVSRERSRTRSRSPLWTGPQLLDSAPSWKTESDPDICPVPKKFNPARPPGHQLNSNNTYKPLDLFKLFFSNDAARTLCQHTNKQAAKNIAIGKQYSWTDIDIQEFFKYVGLTFFFALVKLDNIQEYWKKNTIFSVPFPANVMARDRYWAISWNIHMSDPEKDVVNDRKKGTPNHDRLFRLKPLLDTIKHACKAFYHPRQNISIDERTVATKSHTVMTQKSKLAKLIVLADCSNGYTVDFAVYTGKSQFASGHGLAYDSVMSLIKPAYLGSGFHLYVDHFFTSPRLFKDLFNLNIGACGTYRHRTKECPCICTRPRGSIRWLRDDPLVFVKWMDTHEVTICSTIHQAFSGSTVQRRVKTQNGSCTTKSIPCPTPVMEYNKHMGGIDLSEELIQYYSAHHKSMRWYRTLFLHFLDIAATNSFLLHKELCKEKQEEPMTHKAFLEELTAQLCGVTVAVPPAKAQSGHIPVAISKQTDASKRASYGRKTCLHCRQTRQVNQSTPWKCKECDVALCLIADRNCFEAWHNDLFVLNQKDFS